RTEAVPWARHGARFTRDFEDWVAWLAVRCTASAVSELARVEWHSVGGVCRRVYAELEAARGASRFDGVRRIGIDETSYKKGHKYVTVLPPMYFPPFTPMIHNRSRQPAPAGYANVFPPLSAPPPNLS
ncbi:ISL3 family transposase, partial [Adlercreutzia equolifaciens]